MPVTHKYTLLCDEVRQENNGKFLVIGLYTPDISVPQLPFAMASLSFFNVIETSAAGDIDLAFRLEQGESLIAGGSGKMTVGQPGFGAIPIKLGPIQLPMAGPYTFRLDLGAQTITHDFNVVLAVPTLGVPQRSTRGPVH